MPEGADDLLENISMAAPSGLSYLHIATYRSKMYITSVQRHDSEKIVNSLCRKLESEGLEPEITDNELIEHNIMNLKRLKRM